VGGRGDHDDVQLVDGSDGTRWYARIQQVRGQGIIAQEVAQQVGRDPAVGDRGDGPGCAGQAGEECLQPCSCLP